MPVDPDLRAALDRADRVETADPAQPAPESDDRDAIEGLRRMKAEARETRLHSRDSRVKADMLKHELRIAELISAAESEAAPGPFADLTDEQLLAEVDDWHAGAVAIAANPGSTLRDLQPLTNAAFEAAVERRVAERVAAELARLTDAEGLEQRARELAEPIAERIAEERVAAVREELELTVRGRVRREPEPDAADQALDPLPPGIRDDRGWGLR